MSLTSPFRRRRAGVAGSGQSETHRDRSASVSDRLVGRGLPLLWGWAADANRSKLRGITLAHVLTGDTVSPISFPEFEAFLAFCDISLENLQFIVWYQDYRKRFAALSPEEQARSPSPCVSKVETSAESSSELRFKSNPSESSFRSSEWTPGQLSVSKDSLDGNSKQAKANDAVVPLSLDLSSTILSSSAPKLQLVQNEPICSDSQPFCNEIQNILATFFVPGSRKELSLSSDMRETVIKGSSRTTHPDVFSSVYESTYETVECVSLPRFLENASTNINRPRQLFWYFSALPTFLLGIALALLFILSPSHRFVVPPQSNRAWRLFSVLCFLLSSMMWYKGFRGFCPLLFLRSSRQLRPWELERLIDNKEAHAYCASFKLSKHPAPTNTDPNEFSLTPISPTSCSTANARIAPFLDSDNMGTKESRIEPDVLSESASRPADRIGKEQDRASRNEQFRSRTRNGFHRLPIFGPDRVVEDERIRAVHIHLWWSLVRFGLFWAVVSAAVVLSVPSLH